MRVRWTTPAREQLVSAFEYIAEENRRAAARSADQIWESRCFWPVIPWRGGRGAWQVLVSWLLRARRSLLRIG